ncbi:hypothetical protein [Enterobacter hormaechei]|uniref:hypothetical protein n=1 Tax=Enterobacter hormaechei TaxID=158836 RepID=UPI0038D0B7E9
MKMTRLEAIKAWGRASREGKPIPDDVRKVLISTQNDSLHDFGVEAPTAKEGANKQVISSQADSLIKISRIWADFFPANTSNQPI